MRVRWRDALAIHLRAGGRAVDNVRGPSPGAEFVLKLPQYATEEAPPEVMVVGDEERAEDHVRHHCLELEFSQVPIGKDDR